MGAGVGVGLVEVVAEKEEGGSRDVGIVDDDDDDDVGKVDDDGGSDVCGCGGADDDDDGVTCGDGFRARR